ncbi:MAG: hypothetical protein MUC88_01605 [Planctomycetes bacterium]|jgi:hypothetical protein|nr:hypothetical protein [Planctomycetota bacterium]
MKQSTTLVAIGTILTLAVVVGGGRVSSREAPAQIKWEYRIVSYARFTGLDALGDVSARARNVQELEALNNELAYRMTDLGQQGWELVCPQGDHSFVFKRQVR